MGMEHPYPAGTRIEKANSEPLDGHRDGAQGVILSFAGRLEAGHRLGNALLVPETVWAYFIEWDDMPGVPVGIATKLSRPRIRPLGRSA
jgi:hypothetical protein